MEGFSFEASLSKNVYGFEKLDITKVENIVHFYENLELYSENDRIQMLILL